MSVRESVRARELRGAGRIAVIAAVTVISGFVTSKAARDAILLSSFSIEQLPLFVGISAALSLPIVLLAGRLFVRFSPDRLLPVLNLMSAALLIGEWLLAQEHPDAAAVVVFLHLGSFGAVLVSGFWSIVNERFDVRTAKRYVGRIGVGATIGGILGGLIAERTAVLFEPNMILLVLAILQGISALVLRMLAGHEQRHQDPAPIAPLSSVRTIAQSALLRNLGIVVVLGAVGAAALDYVFKAEVVAVSKNGPLRVLAIYHLGTSVVTALMQILAAQPVLKNLGVARTIATLPLTVTGVGLGTIFIPGLYPAMIARGAEMVMRSSIYRAGYELLYAPLPEHEKRSAKVVIDVGAERIGDLLGAQIVALLIYFFVDPRVPVLIAAVGIGVIAGAFASRVPRAYTRALEHSLVEQARDDAEHQPSSSSPLRWTSLGAPTMSETGGDLTALSLLGLNVAQIREAAAETGNAEPVVREVLMPVTKKTKPAPSGRTRQIEVPSAGESIRRDPMLDQITALRSRNIGRVREILEGELAPDLVPHILPLVAWDQAAPAALHALVQLAPRCTGTIVDALLDTDRDFTIRRRLPAVLTAGDPGLAAWALWRALSDTRFEVRYRAGRALLELRHGNHTMPFTAQDAYDLVDKELSVERTVLKTYRLLDSEPQIAKNHGAEPLSTVSSSTALAHIFNILALALPPEPVRIAFQSLHTQDYDLRATALEYLESALPADLSEKLWPLIDVEQTATPTRPPRRAEDLAAALRMSQPVIEAKLAALTDKS